MKLQVSKVFYSVEKVFIFIFLVCTLVKLLNIGICISSAGGGANGPGIQVFNF